MKHIFPLLLALAALSAFAACGDDEEETATPTPTATPAPTTASATPRASWPTATPLPRGLPEIVCAPNPDPAPTNIVQVNQPSAGDSITSPLQATGQIAAFEATFAITIFDAQGNTLVDQTAMSSEGQTLAPFSATVPFTVSAQTPACVWVYEKSAQDGSPIHVVQVPVTLLP
ncbi:MAG: Gmad2 immunoglobulin-like domain-containing protein [Sulfuricaulis sp.]|nr:Gmad2 immunoglobulin-like domain-containing protein [Sulfuricaulis sp.]